MSGFARFCPRAARRLAAALLCLVALPPAAALTVLYSASLNGNLDGCDCKSTPRAGLAARAAWLRSYPQREPVLLVDAGDLLDVVPDPELAREILESYAELGYDAVAVGDQAPLVFSKGDEKVGLLALLDPQVFTLYPEELRGSMKLEEPGLAAAPLVSAMRAQPLDWVVVLYHGPLEEAERLARQRFPA